MLTEKQKDTPAAADRRAKGSTVCVCAHACAYMNVVRACTQLHAELVGGMGRGQACVPAALTGHHRLECACVLDTLIYDQSPLGAVLPPFLTD